MIVVGMVMTMPMAMPSAARAQSTLLLDPLGEPLSAATEDQLVAALQAIAGESGHRVLRPAPGTVYEALDPSTGDDLQALAGSVGFDRVIAAWIEPGPLGYDILIAVASRERFGAVSRARATSREGLVDAATAALRELLPPDFAAPRGGWEAPLDPHRSGRGRPSRLSLGLLRFGGVMLLATYLPNTVVSAVAGFQSNAWFSGTFDGAWDAFRVVGAIPVVGPWIQLAIAPTPPNGWIPWLVVDGILQGVAAGLLIAGAAIHIEDTAVTPWAGPDRAGLALDGTF